MLRLCLSRGARLAGASSPAAPAPSALPLALATAAAWMPAALARLRPPSVGHIAQTALLPLLLMVGKSKHAGKSRKDAADLLVDQERSEYRRLAPLAYYVAADRPDIQHTTGVLM